MVVNDTASIKYPEELARRDLLKNTKVIFINSEEGTAPKVDSVRTLINSFYLDQFRNFQDPKAPYFMFMSKDANLAMGIGGMVRMRGWFDWNNAVPANGFSPMAMPIPRDPTMKRQFKATPAGTGLFFTIIGRNSPIGNYMGYIEGNFDGYDHVGFKLKKAYFMINDWTVGYATSTFSDPAAQPPVIDGAGANGKISKTNVLVRYLHTFKNKWSVAGSLEFPSSGVTDESGNTKKCADWLPDVSAFGQYQWNDGLSHIWVSGVLRTLSYRDLLTSTNHTCMGWGAQLSSVVKVLHPLSLYAVAAYGSGISSFIGDLSGNGIDLVATPGKPGELYAPSALSLMFGAKYNFTSNIYASMTLSELQYYDKKPHDGTAYRYGLYGAWTLFWDITPRIQVGAEYLAGKRVNFDGSHTNANRIDALFMFSF
ncbi:MAG: DcaP family trimeric outer membrane transporter [Muribaculum sp.]|nr:DcaP family trimeric outer membrane transporter [Muribaculum sp.]